MCFGLAAIVYILYELRRRRQGELLPSMETKATLEDLSRRMKTMRR